MSNEAPPSWLKLPGPAIVLVEPQLGENIGTAARAMANFGLSELRLVAPRDGWPSGRAVAAAAGADQVLEQARLFDTLRDALGEVSFVVAATARQHAQAKPVLSPQAAAAACVARIRAGQRTAIVFGRERNGLESDEVGLADAIVTFPVDPSFSSLNLAQAVLLMAYEFAQAAGNATLPFAMPLLSEPAPKAQLHAFFERLENELERVEFFRPPEKREVMTVNLRNIFTRMEPTRQDIQTLSGVVDALIEGRKGPAAGGVLDPEQALSLRRLLAREPVDASGRLGPVRGLTRLARRNPTALEKAVWATLISDRRLAGRGYKRRVPVGPHIADFVSFPEKTVIELDDGGTDAAAMARRRAWLEERSYRVVLVAAGELSSPDFADRLAEKLAL